MRLRVSNKGQMLLMLRPKEPFCEPQLEQMHSRAGSDHGTLWQAFLQTVLEMSQGQGGLMERSHSRDISCGSGWLLSFLLADCNQSSSSITNSLKLLQQSWTQLDGANPYSLRGCPHCLSPTGQDSG